MRRAAALSCACLLAFASACATPPATREVGLSEGDPRPEAYLALLQSRNHAHQSLSAAMRVSLDAPDLRLRRPQRLALLRPTLLRVEILGLFGQIAALLVSDGSQYQFFDARAGEVQSGPLSDHIFWDLARIDLTPGEAVELLMGAPVPNPRWQRSRAFVRVDDDDDDDDEVAVEFEDPSGVRRQRFEFDARGLPRAVRSYDVQGRLVWHAAYDDYRDVEGSLFPFSIILASERVDATAKFAFQSVRLDPELSRALFRIETPTPISAD
jgi:hypothetical protein